MTEQSGIARAIEVLGDKIAEAEGLRRLAIETKDSYKREADRLREENKKLTERLKTIEDDLDKACLYALQLEKQLEAYRTAEADTHAGGADKCKKS